MRDYEGELAALGQQLEEGGALSGPQVLGMLARFYPGYAPVEHVDPELLERARGQMVAGSLAGFEARARQLAGLIDDDEWDDDDLDVQAVRAYQTALAEARNCLDEDDPPGLAAALARLQAAEAVLQRE